METVYIYNIKTPTGLVVKIGCTAQNAESRMWDYANKHGLTIDSDSLQTISVKDGKKAESAMHEIFLASGYRHITGLRFGPSELFQSEYIRTYNNAIKLFNSLESEPLESLKRDNTKRWDSSELTFSAIANRSLDISTEQCGLVKIVGQNQDVELITPEWHKKLLRALKQSNNAQVGQILTIKFIADTFGYILKDSNGKKYNFEPALAKEQEILARNNRTSAFYKSWTDNEHKAAYDFFTKANFDDVTKTEKHEHIFMTAKLLLQEGYSLAPK
jgi:hypothetical protein